MSRPSRPLVLLASAGTALLGAAGLASANDSSAEIGTGGLVLTEDADVAMVSEDLTISPARIDIGYVFRNGGDADRTLTVAFPLPPIEGFGVSMRDVELPAPASPNFVGFTVEAGGRTIEPTLSERAFLGKTDVTRTLLDAGLPLNPIGDAYAAKASALTEARYRALEKRGLLTPRDMGEALWRYEATFHFAVAFPAGRPVTVRHSYKPVRGMAFLQESLFGEPGEMADYCIDAGTRKAFEGVIRKAGAAAYRSNPAENAALKDDPLGGLAYRAAVPYILTTANNWAGPIGRFHLTIDKGDPGIVVSLCQDGLKKTGPTTFEFTAKNYVPKRDLLVLFGAQDLAMLGTQ